MGHDRTAIQRQFLKKEKVKQGIMAKSTWRKVAHVRKQRGKKRGGETNILCVHEHISQRPEEGIRPLGNRDRGGGVLPDRNAGN